MNTSKVRFKNNEGKELVGYLELPTNQKPHNYVLFAHCFTCNKNFFAPKNISRALANTGYGVLRFDFTGLGESEGDFADTNFSGNVEDLIAASKFLAEEYEAPTILVGHSLGGAAVLFASKQIASVKAIATIGAPSAIKHVEGLLSDNIETIEKQGSARVNIGGRPFKIKKQFLDDLANHDLQEYLSNLDKALLILHAPQDRIVGIKNAEALYLAARHPKSFMSLDGADHLLSKQEDADYTGKVIAAWAYKYIEIPEKELVKTDAEVVANLGSEGFTTQIKAGSHYLTADEPKAVGGDNFGPTPYDFLSAGLAACTSMTIQMYARRKGWKIENVETHINYSKQHAADCEDCENTNSKIDTFERSITLEGDLDEKQQKRIMEIADKCPVHRTLHSETQIITTLNKD